MSSSARTRTLLSLIIIPALLLTACSNSGSKDSGQSSTTEGDDQLKSAVNNIDTAEDKTTREKSEDSKKTKALELIAQDFENQRELVGDQLKGLFSDLAMTYEAPDTVTITYWFENQIDTAEAQTQITDSMGQLNNAEICEATFGPINTQMGVSGPWNLNFIYYNADGSEIHSVTLECE